GTVRDQKAKVVEDTHMRMRLREIGAELAPALFVRSGGDLRLRPNYRARPVEEFHATGKDGRVITIRVSLDERNFLVGHPTQWQRRCVARGVSVRRLLDDLYVGGACVLDER